jgi:hypothetical protein
MKYQVMFLNSKSVHLSFIKQRTQLNVLSGNEELFFLILSFTYQSEGLSILSDHLFSFFFLMLNLLLFIYSHVCTLFGSFLPPAPIPHPLVPCPPCFQAEPVLPLSLILLRKRHSIIMTAKPFCYLS